MMYIRIFSYALLVLLALSVPLPFFLMVTLVYLFFWSGYELLLIGVVIDSLFGMGSLFYTLTIGTLLILYALARPYMSWYTDTHEVV